MERDAFGISAKTISGVERVCCGLSWLAQRADRRNYIRPSFFAQLWEDGGHMYVPAESVYAIFEVRQDLCLEYIKTTGQKVASVRRWLCTEGEFGWLKGTAKKRLFILLEGLLTVNSEWHHALGDPFYNSLGSLP